jgi:heat shock protein HslJ
LKPFFLAAALFAACTTGAAAQQASRDAKPPEAKKDEKPKQEKPFPTKTSWVAVSVNGKSTGSGPERPTFFLDENLRANGFGGCNNYSATAFPLRQNRMAVGPIALTRKACDKAVMDRERDFLLNFKATQEWDIEGGVLLFKGARTLIRFERVL